MKSFMSRKNLNVLIPEAFRKAWICRSSNGSMTSNIRHTSLKDMAEAASAVEMNRSRVDDPSIQLVHLVVVCLRQQLELILLRNFRCIKSKKGTPLTLRSLR